MDTPDEERTECLEQTIKLYDDFDADDEEGEASEVILTRYSGITIAEVRNCAAPHQDLVLKRKRPNSLNRVPKSPMDKENIVKCKAERRSSKRVLKPKMQENFSNKRRVIGVSDYPKPYKNLDVEKTNYRSYITADRKREHSVESDDNSSMADVLTTSENHLNDSYKDKLRDVPSHISESQKLLKTSIFQMPEPQFPTKCLILNIYKIKHQHYEDKSTSPPPQDFSFID